jgi:protein SERAC1
MWISDAKRARFIPLLDLLQNISEHLAFPEMISRLRRIALPSSHTCEWLIALPICKEWKSGRHHFLWLEGKVGSGKSTLMKQAFQTHASSSTAEAYTVLGYFFDAGAVSLEKSPPGPLRVSTSLDVVA